MDIRLGAVREEDISFSATGHNHSGGTSGQQLDVDLAFTDFVHNHSAAADGGVLGLNALRVDEQSAENAGVVTVLSTITTIASLPSMNVLAGDRILVLGQTNMQKGATAGEVVLLLNKESGTAAVQWGNDYAETNNEGYVGAGVGTDHSVSSIVKVTGSGTLVLRLRGISLGSNATISAGFGQIYALVLRGTG